MQKNHPVTRANGTAINTDQRWLVQLHDRGRELYVERRHGGCGVRGTELGGYWCECSEQQEPCCDPHDHPSGTGLGNSRQLFRDVRHASLRLLVTGKGILEGKRELAKEISTFDKTSFLVRTQASALASVAAAPSALLGRRSYLSRSSRTPPTRRHCLLQLPLLQLPPLAWAWARTGWLHWLFAASLDSSPSRSSFPQSSTCERALNSSSRWLTCHSSWLRSLNAECPPALEELNHFAELTSEAA